MLFDGNKDANDNTLLGLNSSVDSDGNTATGVAVKLYESDRNTQIKIGDISQSIDLAEGKIQKHSISTPIIMPPPMSSAPEKPTQMPIS